MDAKSYQELFSKKLKHCKSKKDYKILCKEMIYQYGVIDKVDANQAIILTSLLGEESYMQVITTSIKMYILDSKGIPYDLVSIQNLTMEDIT